MWETCVWSLHWEDLLEKGTATHSTILAWRIPRTEEAGGLQSMGLQKVKHNWASFHFYVNVNINMKLAFWMCRAQKVNSMWVSISSLSEESFDITGDKKKNASWDLLSLGKNYNPTEKENNLEVEKIRIYNEKIN